ncbi:hypothetical protein C7E23_18045 [Elizabethkingia anophelis]|nr:hypothetical protein C7E23_18045 [Elizabethkingia anophelis]
MPPGGGEGQHSQRLRQMFTEYLFRNYADLGVAGRVASVFGSTHFYRVYSESGDLLATSEWNIGEHEVDVFATEWLGQTAMYPTQHGWASFSLKECAAESAQTLHD